MRLIVSPGGIWIIIAIVCRFEVGFTNDINPKNACIPRCVTAEEINTLWSALDLRQYWQCEPVNENDWFIRLKTCSGGTTFDYKQQVCVDQTNILETSNECSDQISLLPPQNERLEICPVPSCTTFQNINTYWAIPEPNYFLHCRPDRDGSWVLEQMPCAFPTLFSFRRQTCVDPEFWEACDGQNDPDDDITTPPVTTAPPTLPPVTTAPPTLPPVTTAPPTLPPVTTEPPTLPPVTTAPPTLPPVTTAPPTLPPVTTAPPTLPPVTTAPPTLPPVTTAPPTLPPVTTAPPTLPPVTTAPPTLPPVTTPSPSVTGPQDDLPEYCIMPRCETWEEINTLWPHPKPTVFYQCRPAFGGGWTPQEMPCAPGTQFSFRLQVCTWAAQREDPCDGLEDPTEPETPTPGITTPGITTPGITTPGITTPGITTPGITTPGITTPELTTPTLPGPTTEVTKPVETPIVDCLTPNCMYLQNSELRWPTKEPHAFYRCIFLLDTVWMPFLDWCPSGTYFSFVDQDCVDPALWEDICADVPEDVTPPQLTTLPSDGNDEGDGELPLPVICGSPRCDTANERSIRWPSTVANQFYECVWVERWFQFIPFPKRCPNFLFFDFLKQDCVDPLSWTDICPIYPTLPPNCPDCCPTCPPATEPPIIDEDPIIPQGMPVPVICGMPRCVTAEEQQFLWPADDPAGYYLCVDSGNGWMQATLLECDAGEFFQTIKQACVPEADYDATFCPIFPPPPTVPTVAPIPANCQAGFNATDMYPIMCDLPRCNTETEAKILWPSSKKETYYTCQQVGTMFIHSLEKCDSGLKFDFFRQCCTAEESSTEMCPFFPQLPPVLPDQPILTCQNEFNPSNILPADCDIPRCETASDIAAYWPSSNSTKFYQCELQIYGIHLPMLQDCPQDTQFDFFRQCCTSTPLLTSNEVCLLFTDVPTVPPPTDPSFMVACDLPRCDTSEEQSFLWPSVNPTMFYNCEEQWDGFSWPQQHVCPPGLWFLVEQQICGEISQHQNVCLDESPTSTTMHTPILTPPGLR